MVNDSICVSNRWCCDDSSYGCWVQCQNGLRLSTCSLRWIVRIILLWRSDGCERGGIIIDWFCSCQCNGCGVRCQSGLSRVNIRRTWQPRGEMSCISFVSRPTVSVESWIEDLVSRLLHWSWRSVRQSKYPQPNFVQEQLLQHPLALCWQHTGIPQLLQETS